MCQETMDIYSTVIPLKRTVLLINKKALIWFSLLFSPWQWINALEFSISTIQPSYSSIVPLFVKLELNHWNKEFFLFSIVLCSECSTIGYQGCGCLNLAWSGEKGRKRESERDRKIPKVRHHDSDLISIRTMSTVSDVTRWAGTMRRRWFLNSQHLGIESHTWKFTDNQCILIQ